MKMKEMKKNELVKKNIGLIYYVIKKFNLNDKLDDYFDLGLIGLTNAINSYNEQLGFKFSTFATDCIKKEIIKEIHKNNCEKRLSNKNSVSLQMQLSKNDDDFTLENVINNDYDLEEEIIKKETTEILKKSMNFLTKNERKVIIKYFGLFGNSQKQAKEIAVDLNVSKYRIYQLRKNAERKIKIFLEKEGYDFND